MKVRKATATWEGKLTEGGGKIQLGSGAFEGPYDHAGRFKEGSGTNPDELVGAALASCYSMFLSALLTEAGHPPQHIETTAHVTLETPEEGPVISGIRLVTEAQVPGLDERTFHEKANAAKENCPVSKAVQGPEISLQASLKS